MQLARGRAAASVALGCFRLVVSGLRSRSKSVVALVVDARRAVSTVRPGGGAVDHRVPLALAGATTLANLWLLCSSCNDAKTTNDLKVIRDEQRGVKQR
jgi:hypothetical protein